MNRDFSAVVSWQASLFENDRADAGVPSAKSQDKTR